LEELDHLDFSQNEITSIVSDTRQFLAGLEFTFGEGLPQEKLVALRQCIALIEINKPANQIRLILKKVPACNCPETEEVALDISSKNKKITSPILHPGRGYL